jgi:hypothetical protein
MTTKELSLLTNAELNIRLKTLENKYEIEQKKAEEIVKNMIELDSEYNKVKKEIANRTDTLWTTGQQL